MLSSQYATLHQSIPTLAAHPLSFSPTSFARPPLSSACCVTSLLLLIHFTANVQLDITSVGQDWPCGKERGPRCFLAPC